MRPLPNHGTQRLPNDDDDDDEKNKNRNPTKLFTAIAHIMTTILCYAIIYEKVNSKYAKNRQYLKMYNYKKNTQWYVG